MEQQLKQNPFQIYLRAVLAHLIVIMIIVIGIFIPCAMFQFMNVFEWVRVNEEFSHLFTLLIVLFDRSKYKLILLYTCSTIFSVPVYEIYIECLN